MVDSSCFVQTVYLWYTGIYFVYINSDDSLNEDSSRGQLTLHIFCNDVLHVIFIHVHIIVICKAYKYSICLLFISNRFKRMGPDANHNMFYMNWFANIQDLIDNSIINLHGKYVQGSTLETLFRPGILLHQFSYPCYISKWYAVFYVYRILR